jgi:hypothetical protein
MKIEHLSEGKYDAKDFFGTGQADAKKIVLEKANQLVAYIKQNCKPWLVESKKGLNYVYRGFSGNPRNLAFLKDVRQNRRPRDSGRKQHEVMDFMITACGKVANRSNSIFTTSDISTATEYGTAYVAIPVGNFHYTWHVDLDDWHGHAVWEDASYLRRIVEPAAVQAPAMVSQAEWKEERSKVVKRKEQLNKILEPVAKLFPVGVDDLYYLLRRLDANTEVPIGKNIFDAGTAKNPFPNIEMELPEVDQDGYAFVAGADYFSVKVSYKRSVFLKSWSGKLYKYILKLSTDERKLLRAAILKADLYHEYDLAVNDNRWGFLTREGKYTAWWSSKPLEPSIGLFPSYAAYKKAGVPKEKKPNDFWAYQNHTFKELDIEYLRKTFGKGLFGDDKTFPKAVSTGSRYLSTGSEVMIATNTVLAIRPSFYSEVVLPLLLGRKPIINNPHKWLNPWHGGEEDEDDDYNPFPEYDDPDDGY